MPNKRFKEMSRSHDAVTTYAHATAALGGETNDKLITAFYDIKNYDAILGIGVASNVVATHTVAFQMYQGSDTDGAGSATVGSASNYVSSQVTDRAAYVVEIDADMLTDGLDYVGLQASTDDADGTEDVTVMVIPSFGRYRQATTPA